ncbi:Uncharacterised protein [Mycobacteroides abscessus subsp. massiliense]|nr:Uncharacterised protein [Mycobacteroides abscessus subsp. massiliense]
MEADEGQPEVELAQALVEQTARHLREPEVHPGEGREDDGAEEHVVKMCDNKIRVGHMEIQGR